MIGFLHTSEVHIASFDALRDRFAPDLEIRHVVREDLLEQAIAQGGVTPEIEAAAKAALAGIMTGDAQAIVCTCSTLGAVGGKL